MTDREMDVPSWHPDHKIIAPERTTMRTLAQALAEERITEARWRNRQRDTEEAIQAEEEDARLDALQARNARIAIQGGGLS